MTIHREGKKIIAGTSITLILLNFSVFYFGGSIWFVTFPLAIISAVILFFVLWFFRIPNRSFKADANAIIAPADGKVVVIEEAIEDEYFHGKRLQVSIFMSPLNVHVNRYPVSGSVSFYKYHAGEFLVAWHPKSSTLNERTTLVLKTVNGIEILVRQIAGAVARRIVAYSKVGAEIQQGDELGFIKFGSRVDLFLPLDAKINVKIDQKVVGNQTIIGYFK